MPTWLCPNLAWRAEAAWNKQAFPSHAQELCLMRSQKCIRIAYTTRTPAHECVPPAALEEPAWVRLPGGTALPTWTTCLCIYPAFWVDLADHTGLQVVVATLLALCKPASSEKLVSLKVAWVRRHELVFARLEVLCCITPSFPDKHTYVQGESSYSCVQNHYQERRIQTIGHANPRARTAAAAIQQAAPREQIRYCATDQTAL